MKLFTKLLLFILILGLAAPFILKRPDGKPWMNISQFMPDMQAIGWRIKGLWHDTVRETEKITSGTEEPSSPTAIYRWQDEHGAWQFSDSPNPNGKSEQIWIDPNDNVLQMPSNTTSTPQNSEKKATDAAQEGRLSIPLPTSVPPSQISNLIEEAKQVQELMDKRTEALQE